MKTRLLITTLVCLAFMALAVFLGKHYNERNRLTLNALLNFQEKLHKKELIAEKMLTMITGCREEPSYTLFHDHSFEENLKDNGIEIQVYSNDTLIFWSDNKAPYVKEEDSLIADPAVINLRNGTYFRISREKGSLLGVALIKLKSIYPYENEFLVNSFQKEFNLSDDIEIVQDKGESNIYARDGSFVFSLNNPNDLNNTENNATNILFLVYLLVLLLLIAIFHQIYTLADSTFKRKYPYTLFFALDLVILRFLIYVFKIPAILYNSDLFNPSYTSSSWFFPSIGDSLVNLIFLLIIVLVLFKRLKWKIDIKKNVIINTLVTVFLFALLCIVFIYTEFIVEKTIQDSSYYIDLKNAFDVNFVSILGLINIVTIYIIAVVITAWIVKNIAGLVNFKIALVLLLIIISSFIACSRYVKLPDMISGLFYLLIIIYLGYLYYYNRKIFSVGSVAGFIILLSTITTYTLALYNNEKNIEDQKLFVSRISEKGNPALEYSFSEIYDSVQNDSVVKKIISKGVISEVEEQIIADIIALKFNSDLWKNYEILITICNEDKILNILPEDFLISCDSYFNGIIDNYGTATICTNLFFLDQNTLDKNFLGFIDMKGNNSDSITIYVELFSKFVPEGLGYPELLISSNSEINDYLKNYSLAKYINKELVYKFGNYLYSFNLEADAIDTNLVNPLEHNAHDHYHYHTDENTDYVLSLKAGGFFDFIAPFSYLLLLYIIYFLAIYFASGPVMIRYTEFTLRKRLQYSVIGIIFSSFLIIGGLSVLYIVRLNDNKTNNILQEKSYSVLIELEHKLADYEKITPDMQDYLYEILNKFSQVFFSDINLYDMNGTLIASSRPSIFDEGFISSKMDENAFRNLAIDNKLLCIQKEMIGSYEYLSAYLPLRNTLNNTTAYLNLPYFAKQEELKNEISTFITAFINVYVILFAIAIFITVIISRYITRPLKLIREKIGKLQLGKAMEKIDWDRKDEVGSLIMEYNRMLDELVKSAELLAKTERETAWREMAKQVAHEIKNPLTPMKLSVQHLVRSRDDHSEEWDKQFKRITGTLIEHIDSLSAIASEFSDFAKMPVSKDEKIDLVDVIKTAFSLYKNIGNIHFRINYDEGKSYCVFADKRQILRVFNNLFENAVQALENQDPGEISIALQTENNFHLIKVTDNGKGIEKEFEDKIFSPSFTTKSSGMGLGLAIVKSILLDAGGEIAYDSSQGEGTTFIIKLPELLE